MSTATLIRNIEALESRLNDSIKLNQMCVAVLEITRCHLMRQLAYTDPAALLDFICAASEDEIYAYLY